MERDEQKVGRWSCSGREGWDLGQKEKVVVLLLFPTYPAFRHWFCPFARRNQNSTVTVTLSLEILLVILPHFAQIRELSGFHFRNNNNKKKASFLSLAGLYSPGWLIFKR